MRAVRLGVLSAAALILAASAAAQTAPQDPAAARAAAAEALRALAPDATTPEQLRPLILALDRAEAAGAPAEPLLIEGWTTVLERLVVGERWRDAQIAADRAIGMLGMLDAPPRDLRLAAAEAGARAAINTGAYDTAAWRYAWGAAALSPVTEDGAIDPLWADLTVRAAAARAAHRSLDEDDPGDTATMPAMRGPQHAAIPSCAPEWTEAPVADIPRRVLRADPAAGLPGAVLVTFGISAGGAPLNAAVLAIAPQGRAAFTEAASAAAVEAARAWRAEPGSVTGCDGVSYVAVFEFVRED